MNLEGWESVWSAKEQIAGIVIPIASNSILNIEVYN